MFFLINKNKYTYIFVESNYFHIRALFTLYHPKYSDLRIFTILSVDQDEQNALSTNHVI